MASPTPSFTSRTAAGSWRTASALRHRCPFPHLTTGSRADAPWKNDQPPGVGVGAVPPLWAAGPHRRDACRGPRRPGYARPELYGALDAGRVQTPAEPVARLSGASLSDRHADEMRPRSGA